MRLSAIVLLMILTINSVQANNFYQSNNPFPEQTCEPEFRNIYATEPMAEVKEEMTNKKMGFWNRNKKSAAQEESSVTDEYIKSSPDGSFYVFPAK